MCDIYTTKNRSSRTYKISVHSIYGQYSNWSNYSKSAKSSIMSPQSLADFPKKIMLDFQRESIRRSSPNFFFQFPFVKFDRHSLSSESYLHLITYINIIHGRSDTVRNSQKCGLFDLVMQILSKQKIHTHIYDRKHTADAYSL